MHISSRMKMECFRDEYLATAERVWRVLDVGSMSYSEHDTYRPLFSDRSRYTYVGLDVAPGPNVDVAPQDPYCWQEVSNESFDAVISGQVMEHNPYFWLTMAEISRVLKPGGLCCLVVPSQGEVHRYPLDCWRFYPDAPTALLSFVGLDLIEGYREDPKHRAVDGLQWRDTLAIGRKPERDLAAASAYYERLHTIVSTRLPMPAAGEKQGPAVQRYEALTYAAAPRLLRFKIEAALQPYHPRPVMRSIRRRLRGA